MEQKSEHVFDKLGENEAHLKDILLLHCSGMGAHG